VDLKGSGKRKQAKRGRKNRSSSAKARDLGGNDANFLVVHDEVGSSTRTGTEFNLQTRGVTGKALTWHVKRKKGRVMERD